MGIENYGVTFTIYPSINCLENSRQRLFLSGDVNVESINYLSVFFNLVFPPSLFLDIFDFVSGV